MKKKISPSTASVICTLLILVGSCFLFYNYFTSQKIKAYDYMSQVFYNEKEETVENLNLEVIEEEKEEPLPEEISDDYIGYLYIPKINLIKGFLDYRSENNNLDYNLIVINGSKYPNIKKGNLIIAGHSGTAWNSFFNDLYQLEENDTCYIDYKGHRYNYVLKRIYQQQKTGKIAIFRDGNKTTLTLITCTNNDSETQTIYIWELESVTD